MKISVIIPAYNEEEYLPQTLAHLVRAAVILPHESEIIVVDNGSSDHTKRIAESLGARIFTEREPSIGKVRNTGAQNSFADVLIFVDADTFVPETLLSQIARAMEDEKCIGGAVAVEYAGIKRKSMQLYLMGWKFWGMLFNMKQGAAQFCRRAVFDELQGYDATVFVGEDVEFYWRLSRFARKNGGYLNFIEDQKVTTSGRRFEKMSLWKTLLLTHPVFIYLAWRKKSLWKDWYENAVR
ncbi:MAG TPA: glycosyltransferase [Pyrinomonadaceae bacterium]|nr:glycosyltransferase [Pyrinomonadaceae bacterium]